MTAWKPSRATFECKCGNTFEQTFDDVMFREETTFRKWPVTVEPKRHPTAHRDVEPIYCPDCGLYKDVETVEVERGDSVI